MSWKLCDFVTTSRVKPSAESWVQISSDYRRWCHALWRQLRLLSTPSRQPAAPGGSGSPPSPSAHLVGRRLLSSESVEIKMEEKKKNFFTPQHLSLVFFYKLSSLRGCRALQDSKRGTCCVAGFCLAAACADEGLSWRFSSRPLPHAQASVSWSLSESLTVEQMKYRASFWAEADLINGCIHGMTLVRNRKCHPAQNNHWLYIKLDGVVAASPVGLRPILKPRN